MSQEDKEKKLKTEEAAGGTLSEETAAGGAQEAEASLQEEAAEGEAAEEKKTAGDAGAPEAQNSGEAQKPGDAGGEAAAGAPDEKAAGAKKKADPRDAQIEELRDKLRRQMAEFDNFRKRTEREKSAMYEIGARDIIEKVLPVLDNLERGLAAMPEDVKGSSFAEGVEKIYRQFVKTLEDAGVEPIESVGKPFDPNLHNAVMHVDDENFGENEVSLELQKGYRYHGTVVRHSMVQVAN